MSKHSTTKRILFKVTPHALNRAQEPNETNAKKHCDISPICSKFDSIKESNLLLAVSIEYCPMLKCKYCNKQYKIKGAYHRHMVDHYKYKMMSVNRLLKIVKQEAKYEYKPTIKFPFNQSCDTNGDAYTVGHAVSNQNRYFDHKNNLYSQNVLERIRRRKNDIKKIPKNCFIRELNKYDSSTDDSNFDD